jgi:hypothetical protein
MERYGAFPLIAATVVIFHVAVHPAAGQEDAVGARVMPRYCYEPCRITITIAVEPHEGDRQLIVEGDSGAFYRSSVIQLDGDDEPAVHNLTWRSLPAGAYRIHVILKRAGGTVANAAAAVTVLP